MWWLVVTFLIWNIERLELVDMVLVNGTSYNFEDAA